MEHVALDVLGPLPETNQGNKYNLHKWPEAYALANQEAVTIADILVFQFFSWFGVPGELHSDQILSCPCPGGMQPARDP